MGRLTPSNGTFDWTPLVGHRRPRPYPLAIEVNGTLLRPHLCYSGAQAGLEGWAEFRRPGGGELAIASSGNAPSFNAFSTVRRPAHRAVALASGQVYQSGSTTFGNVTTEDILWEMVLIPSTNVHYLFNKKNNASGQAAGWYVIQITANTVIQMGLGDGTVAKTANSPTLSAGAYWYVAGFANVDENSTSGMRLYGALLTAATPTLTAGTGVNPSGIGSITNTTHKFTVGATQNLAAKSDASIAWICMWIGAGVVAAGAAGEAEVQALFNRRYRLLRRVMV